MCGLTGGRGKKAEHITEQSSPRQLLRTRRARQADHLRERIHGSDREGARERKIELGSEYSFQHLPLRASGRDPFLAALNFARSQVVWVLA